MGSAQCKGGNSVSWKSWHYEFLKEGLVKFNSQEDLERYLITKLKEAGGGMVEALKHCSSHSSQAVLLNEKQFSA